MTRYIVSLCVWSCSSVTCMANVSSFEQIERWVGSGSNEAALVIDWNGERSADSALVWGYRWDGSKTLGDMLLGVVSGDDRLFFKRNVGSFGLEIRGIGYDQDNDGVFGISDGSTFNAQGITDSGDSDSYVATDPGDFYSEGWFTAGFWYHTVATTSPTGWSDGSGAPGAVADGQWNALTFDGDFSSVDEYNEDFTQIIFDAPPETPTNLQPAAVPEPWSIALVAIGIAGFAIRRPRR